MQSTFSICTTVALMLGVGAWHGQAETPRETEAAILARLKMPTFPAQDFIITKFGAVEKTDCTDAIAQAIKACVTAGGGRVLVPAGVWSTGAIHLRSGVELHIAEGATLRFDPDPAKYLPVVLTRFEGMECMNYSPLIYCHGQENVAITGKGMLDGSANDKTWWAWTDKDKDKPTKQVPARAKLDEQVNIAK